MVRRPGGRESSAWVTAARFAGVSPSTIFSAWPVFTDRRVAGAWCTWITLRKGLPLRLGLLRLGLIFYKHRKNKNRKWAVVLKG